MHKFVDSIFTLMDNCHVDIDLVGIENHINNYFKQHGNRYLCHYSGYDFVFAQYDSFNNHVCDKNYSELNRSTAKALIKYLKKCFETERQIEELHIAKRYRYKHKVADCKITNITKTHIHAVFYDDKVPITVRCAISRVPKKLHPYIKMGATMPFYLARLGIDFVEANLHDLKIPEVLLQEAIDKVCKENRAITPPKYLKCIKRICGVYSYILTDRKVDKKIMMQISAKLNNESVYVYFMKTSEFRALKDSKITKTDFIKKMGRKRRGMP